MKCTKQMLTLLTITAVLVLTRSWAYAGVVGGPISNPANSHSYYLLTNNNWTGSQAEAVTLGGDLVTINDASENVWVNSTFSNFGDTPRSLWIGFNDVASEGNWVWASGETVSYTNWWSGQPDNVNNEDYAYMGQNGGWGDGQNGLWAGYNLYGVVEVIPEPATVGLLMLGGLALLRGRRRFRPSQ